MSAPSSRKLGRLLVGAVVACALSLAARPATAKPAEGPPWLKLDRVAAEPSWIDGIVRLRVYVSAVELEGGTIDIQGEDAFTLKLGSSKERAPYLSGRFGSVQDDEIALSIVVCATSGFSQEMPAIVDALRELVDGLPKTTQVSVISYTDDVHGDRRMGSQRRGLSAIDALEADTIPSESVLLKAVTRATRTFRKLEPTEDGHRVRRIMLIVSDGKDIDHTPSRFRQAARKAEREDIRIHTLAYSRENQRQPMLGLAELSKQTHGTFRLAYTAHSFGAKIKQLGEEIRQQYVLTYYLPKEEVEGKRLRVLAREMVSNDIKVKEVTCGFEGSCESGQYCAFGTCLDRPADEGRGFFGWVLVIILAGVGGLAVLVAIGFVLTRREEKKKAAAALWEAAAQAGAAEAPPDNRIQPQAAPGQVQPQPPPGQVQPQPPPGQAQPRAPHAPAAPRAQAPRASSLFVVKGDRQGQYIPIRHGFRIGKAPDCDLVLNDGFASSHHAHLEMDKGGNVVLVDESSTNGTFVNGVRETRKQLQHGTLITIGQTELRFMQG